MYSENDTGEVTQLFSRWRQGDGGAFAELIELLYQELRKLAGSQLRREGVGHTLAPTELLHEALLRLLGADVQVENRLHFFALAARAMRRVLVDHARRKQAAKRLSAQDQTTLSTEVEGPGEFLPDVLAVHTALERFAQIAPRPARLVELRYFGGLTIAEAAEVMEVSCGSAERDWKIARLWLRRELSR